MDVAIQDGRRAQWVALQTATACLLVGMLLWVGLAVSDREAVVLGLVALGGIAGLRARGGLLGDVVLGLVFVDTALWLVPAAVDNIAHHDRFTAVALPVALSSVALVGVAADAERLLERRRPAPGRAGRRPLGAAAGGAALMVGTLLVALVVGVGRGSTLPPGGIAISARNTAFSPSTVHVTTAGQTPSGTLPIGGGVARSVDGKVTVALTNHDLFWHTFTIDRLGVSLRVPVAGRRQVTFSAPPGTYVFYCAIPGHRAAGMEGTLVIEPPPGLAAPRGSAQG